MQLLFDARKLPVIGRFPMLPPVKVPIMMVKSPAVVTFEHSNVFIRPEKFHLTWLDHTSIEEMLMGYILVHNNH